MPFSVPVLVLLTVFVVAAAGWWWSVVRERRRPSSYSRRPDVLAEWRVLPTAVQAARDEAALDAGEAAAARARLVPALILSVPLPLPGGERCGCSSSCCVCVGRRSACCGGRRVCGGASSGGGVEAGGGVGAADGRVCGAG